MPRRLAAAALLAAAVGAIVPAGFAFASEGPREQPLEQAREEAGVEPPGPQRFDLPEGELQITPSSLLAGSSGQKLRFSVTLDRAIAGATLEVTLPRRWVSVPASGLRAIRTPKLDRGAGRARVRRSDRTVVLTLERTDAGQTASFEIADVGIPASAYRLPFSWRDRNGVRTRAGSARVFVYARSREGPEGGRWARLSNPGVPVNASDDSTEESETFITVTPGNKNRIAVGSNWDNSSMVTWISIDGGASWIQNVLPSIIDAPGQTNNENGDICCDPMFAADAAGNIWFGGLSFDTGPVPSRIVVNRIAAGQTSFQPVTTGLPQQGNGTQDKPMMTIDNTPTSPTFGRLYVVWDEPQGPGVNVVISQCDTRPAPTFTLQAERCDDADNWTAPALVTPAADSPGSFIYADVAVGPTGLVYVTWWDYSINNAIRGDVCTPTTPTTCASAAGWGALPAASTIALLDSTGGLPLPFSCPILAQPGGRASTSSQVDVDHSGGANNGRVYVTWSDLRTGSGSTRCDDVTDPASTHLSFDSFVASAPGGALPGSANISPTVGTRLITDGEGGGQSNSDDWFAWLAVDQTSGQAWADLYSTRDDPSRQTTNFYARSVTPTSSVATTHTVGPLTKVSSAPSDYSDPFSCCDFRNDYGDYTGLDATQGVAFPVWTDNSTGDGDAFTFVAPIPPIVVTLPASGVGATSATLRGTVNPRGSATTYQFQYGTSPGSAQFSAPGVAASAGSGTSAALVTRTVSGLSPGTVYYYRVVAQNSAGTKVGAEQSFQTTSATALLPSVTTGAASQIRVSSATVSGSVNPNGHATTRQFEFGTTPSYGFHTASLSVGSGTSFSSTSAVLPFLEPNTTYHYRLTATSSVGTRYGADRTFKTAPDLVGPKMKVSRRSLRMSSSGRVRVKVSCDKGEPEACAGTLRVYTVKRKASGKKVRVRLGSKKFKIAPGKSKRVRVKLSPRGRRLVRAKGAVKLIGIARARDASGNLGKASRRFLVRAPL